MLTEKDFCDYETCVALRKLRFPRWELPYDILSKKYCLRLYDAQKWLREEKKIEVVVLSRGMIGKPYYYQVYKEDSVRIDDKNYDSYEEALSEGIKEAITILENDGTRKNSRAF